MLLIVAYLHFLIQVRQEVSPVVMTVIPCLVSILQHAGVILSLSLMHTSCYISYVRILQVVLTIAIYLY